MGTLAETILERDKPACRQAGSEDAGVVLHYAKDERRSRSPKAASPFGVAYLWPAAALLLLAVVL